MRCFLFSFKDKLIITFWDIMVDKWMNEEKAETNEQPCAPIRLPQMQADEWKWSDRMDKQTSFAESHGWETQRSEEVYGWRSCLVLVSLSELSWSSWGRQCGSNNAALHCRAALFAAVTTAPQKQPNRGQQGWKWLTGWFLFVCFVLSRFGLYNLFTEVKKKKKKKKLMLYKWLF